MSKPWVSRILKGLRFSINNCTCTLGLPTRKKMAVVFPISVDVADAVTSNVSPTSLN